MSDLDALHEEHKPPHIHEVIYGPNGPVVIYICYVCGDLTNPDNGKCRDCGATWEPPCTVPKCTNKAPVVFTVPDGETGWFAGGRRVAGDKIVFCWEHARLVYRGVDPYLLADFTR